MAATTSRRSVLAGAAAIPLVAAACANPATKRSAEITGAFPQLPGDGELLGPQPGVARLNNNENPYGPAESARRHMDYALRKGAYYPDKAIRTLSTLIAERHGVSPDHVTVSTGSAEALSAIALVYGQQGPIVAPRLFFDATLLYAERLGLATILRAPMAADMAIDLAAVEAAVTAETALVQLCNPNNPTGLLTDSDALHASVRRMAQKTTVVVDEAYMELTDAPQRNSCVDLVRDGHDVIVARTFSKLYGMAGIRVGYVISSPDTAKRIRSAKMSWMSGVGIAGAIGCYNDKRFVDFSLARIVEAREQVTTTLRQLDATALASQTNFVYFKSGMPANDLQRALAARNIMIRGQYMDYSEWSRVSMGRLEDIDRFCRVLPEVLDAQVS